MHKLTIRVLLLPSCIVYGERKKESEREKNKIRTCVTLLVLLLKAALPTRAGMGTSLTEYCSAAGRRCRALHAW